MTQSRLKQATTDEIRGQAYNIREWNANERAEFLKRGKSDAMLAGIYLAHRCTLTAEGKLVWPKESDAGNEPPELIDALATAILKLSGVETPADADEGGAEKND